MKLALAALVVMVVATAASAQGKRVAPANGASAGGGAALVKKRTVGILDVRVDGVPDDVKVQFEKGLEEQLENSTYWLSTRAQMRERLKFSTKWTEGCLVGACLTEAKTQTNAELVLLVALSGAGTSFGFVVTLARTDNGRVVAQDSGRCDVCTPREAMRDATLATINLLNNVPDRLPDEAADRSAAIDLAVGKLARHIEADKAKVKKRGIIVTVLGLAAVAAGVTLYVVADKPDYSLAVAGAGGGLTLGGVAMLTF